MSDTPGEREDRPLDEKDTEGTGTDAADVGRWPRCAYCGSPLLHESTRGGLRENLLRLVGASLYRCEECGRRFAFAALGHPGRHRGPGPVNEPVHRRHSGHSRSVVTEPQRRRAIRLLATLAAAVLTFLVAAWLISRAERKRLEGDGIEAPSPN